MASATATTDPNSTWVDANPNTKRDIISRHAYMSGLKAASAALVVSGAGAYAAENYWRAFRTRLNVSAKTALVISPALAVFSLVAELRLASGVRDPDRYLAQMEGRYVEVDSGDSKLKLWQRAANQVYDHPFKVLTTVSVPLVASIYAFQHANKNISASQQVMTTRIYGQSAVVILLLSSMAFHDYMSKRGRFEPPQQEEEQ